MKCDYDDLYATFIAWLEKNRLYWQSGKLYHENGREQTK